MDLSNSKPRKENEEANQEEARPNEEEKETVEEARPQEEEKTPGVGQEQPISAPLTNQYNSLSNAELVDLLEKRDKEIKALKAFERGIKKGYLAGQLSKEWKDK